MCGAFTFVQANRIFKELGLEAAEEFLNERFNVRPTNEIPVVLSSEPNVVQNAHWGLTPSWGKEKGINLLFNTRSDSLIEKPYFNRLFNKNRCIIPADGFYEWAKVGSEKLPYRFVLKNEDPFVFAGIWLMHEGKPQVSLITTEANALVEPIHARMPAIIPLDHAKEWVQNIGSDKLVPMLDPYPAELMKSYRVSKDVNSNHNDTPELIKPIN